RRIMLYEVPKRQKQDFPIPSQIVAVDADNVSGYPSHDGFPSHQDYFIDSNVPKDPDPIHLKLKVCKGSSGLAAPADIASNNYDEKEFLKFREDDPVSKDGVNRWQQGIDQWISQQQNKDIYNPPDNYCRTDGNVAVRFDSPHDHDTVGNNFDIKINTDSLKKINEVKLWINGNDKQTWNERPFELNGFHLDDGLYDLKVQATDKDGATATQEIHIGVNKPWDWTPSPTPTLTLPTATPTLTVLPSTTSIH
ncbi:MAG TPA: hypothetical protein VF828_02510, partial [Patescibacteria group bacterium]